MTTNKINDRVVIKEKRMTVLLRVLIFVLGGICISGTLYANVIVGNVYDSQTNNSLPGVHVYIKGTTIGAITNTDGYYQLPIVREGEYVLVASYIGYTNAEQAVVVEQYGMLVKDFYLTYGTTLSEFVITAQAEGQLSAINQQLASNTITNIISAKRIQEVPDANAAESVGRIPGISLMRNEGEGDKVVVRGMDARYNMITINGTRAPSTSQSDRSTGLAGISPYMLEGIEVQKALTPDKDADVIGAIIDLKLKDAPEGFRMNVVAENSVNRLNRSNFNPRLTLQGSNRFFRNKLGIYAQANYESIDRSNQIMTAGYTVEAGYLDDGTRISRINGASFIDKSLVRERYGASVMMDYRLPSGSIKYNSFVNGLSDDVYERQRTFSLEGRTGVGNNNYLTEVNGTTWINSLNYEQKLFLNSTLDMGLSYNSFKSNTPYRIELGTSFLNALVDQVKIYNSSPYVLSDISQFEPANSYINAFTFNSNLFREDELMGQINWQIPFLITNQINGYLKVGGKYSMKNRSRDRNSNTVRFGEGEFNPIIEEFITANESLGFNERVGASSIAVAPIVDHDYSKWILDGKYFMESFVLRDHLKPMYDRMNPGIWNAVYTNRTREFMDDYEGSDTYSAAYIMSEMNLGRMIRLVGGVRYEKMVTNYNGWGIIENRGASEFEKLNSVRENDYLLPMINARIKPLQWFDIRLSYTQSLARPNYTSFIPSYRLSLLKTLSNLGNTSITPALAHNYDVYFSFSNNKLGLFTIGGFYKELEGFEYWRNINIIDQEEDNAIHGYSAQAVAGTFMGMSYNNPNTGTVQGIELDWQTVFWYLPKPLNGLVLNVNYTMIESQTKYFTSIVKQLPGPSGMPWDIIKERVDSFVEGPLVRQPDDIFNISIGYDLGGFSSRLAYNFQGRTLIGSGGAVRENDTFSYDFHRWDLSMRQRLPVEGLQVFLNISNLSNSINQNYRFDRKFITNEGYYGTQVIIGLRYNF